MKPLHLSLTAFGPYMDKTEFPMGALGDDGLYLITGDTGAGKTTIFDGICFALFGETSASVADSKMKDGKVSNSRSQEKLSRNRQGKDMRCDLVDDSVDTEVVLLFEVNDKRYTITRKLKVDKSGGVKEAVRLELMDEVLEEKRKIYTSLKEVALVIVDILKMDGQQFRQIAMIAQGAFQDVLLATTAERIIIMQKLFGTKNYNSLEEGVKQKSNELEAQVSACRSKLEELVPQFQCHEDDLGEEETALFDEIQKEAVSNVEESLLPQKMSDFIELQTKVHEACGVALKTNSEAMDKLKAYFSSLSELEKIRANMSVLMDKVDGHKKKLAELTQKKADLGDYLKEVEVLQEEIRGIEAYLKLLEGVEQAEKKIGLEQEKERVLLEQKEGFVPKKKSLEEEKITLSEAVERLAPLDISLTNLQHQVELEQINLGDLSNLSGKIKNHNKLVHGLEKAQEEYKRAETTWEKSRDILAETRKRERMEQAGILAQDLEDGVPCAVCGSLEHPNKAILTSAAVVVGEVEELEEAEKVCKSALDKAVEAAAKAKGKLESDVEEIEALGTKLFEVGEFEEIVSVLSEKEKVQKQLIADMNENLSALKVEKAAIVSQKAKLVTVEKKMLDLKQEEMAVAEKCEAQLLLIRELTGGKETLEKQLNDHGRGEESGENLKSKLGSLKKSVVDKKALGEKVHRDLELETNVGADLTGQLSVLQEQEKQYPPLADLLQDKEKNDVLRNELERKNTELLAKNNRVYACIDGNKKVVSGVSQTLAESGKLLKKSTWMKQLKIALCKGTKPGEVATLESYVQREYFNKMLVEANLILGQLTAERYEMYRDESEGASDLDICLHDSKKGRECRARKLSGGEKFQASLAMALGFTAVIQQESSAVQVKSLFLDEGFGTLDQQSLREAVNTLLSISNSGRLVGIISHVPELQDVLMKQIHVQEGDFGSQVKFKGLEEKLG